MDVQWCPFCSTVFACAIANGKIEVDDGPLLSSWRQYPRLQIWDVSISTVKPIAYHTIPGRCLTKLAFNPKSKVLMCGDDQGDITVLQLINVIPNVTSSKAEQQEQLRRVIHASVKN